MSESESIKTMASLTPESTKTDEPATIWRRQQRSRLTGLLVVVIFGALMCLWSGVLSDQYKTAVLVQILLYAIAGVGFYLIIGLSGQFAFSQSAVFGLGAYASVWAGQHTGFWLSVAFAVLVVSVVTAALRLLLWRASEFYFAIATLGFSQICIIVFEQWTSFAGPAGEAQASNAPHVFGIVIDSSPYYFWLSLAILVITLLLTSVLIGTPLRGRTIAVRDRPEASAGLGIAVLRNQTGVYVLGSSYAAVAGALFAHSQGFISPSSFSLALGIDLFLIVILGGMFSMWGAVLGAFFVVGVPEIVRSAAEYRSLIFSILLVVTIIFLPEGFMGAGTRFRSAASNLVRRFRRDA